MQGKERRISDRSLENLKLGAQARYQGKVRQNFTVLPETLEWLKCSGNASSMIDDLVDIAKNGGLKSNNTYQGKDGEQLVSDDVYKRSLSVEVKQLRSQLAQAEAALREEQAQKNSWEDSAVQWQTIAEQAQEQLIGPASGLDLEAERDRFLAGLRLGKQAPEYKRTKSVIDRFIASVG